MTRHQECDGCGADTGDRVGFCEGCEAERKEALAAHGVTPETVLRELLDYERDAFEDDTEVDGADLVDWFAAFRERVKAVLGQEAGL